jgi:cysteine desulfurase / selenocysteine lyase
MIKNPFELEHLQRSIPMPLAEEIERIRGDFPILHQKVHGRPLVYLDNAATSQKPRVVIETIQRFYSHENANINRGIHFLSEEATRHYELAREKVRALINAPDKREVIFVRGTTEAINLVAQCYGRSSFTEGDEILITAMEHHSNIVPWQILCEQTGARLRVAPVDQKGDLMMDEFDRMIGEKTKLVSLTHVSNVLGTINPVQEIVRIAHEHGAPVMIDGAQAVPHIAVNVQEIDCDFYCFSGHKLFGPTGIGILYGKKDLLEKMPPYQGGGDMISMVTFEKTLYNVLPHKFEAGTPHIEGSIGLGAAVDYVQGIGLDRICHYEEELVQYAMAALSEVPGLRLIGTPKEKAAVVAFIIENVHAHDVGTVLDTQGIAIRAGHHCAMPLMKRYQIPAAARASFAFYNTKGEVDALVKALGKVKEVFG